MVITTQALIISNDNSLPEHYDRTIMLYVHLWKSYTNMQVCVDCGHLLMFNW